MISHETIKIVEKQYPSQGVSHAWEIYCGQEQVGSITEWETLATHATCFFKRNTGKDVDSLEEGVKYIEQELEAYISSIIRIDA